MPEKISLKKIIESVLDDNEIKYDKCNDSNVRRLRRAFWIGYNKLDRKNKGM